MLRAYAPDMDIDAALTLFSFAGFLALLVGWLLAPLRAEAARADAPTHAPAPEAAIPGTAVAA